MPQLPEIGRDPDEGSQPTVWESLDYGNRIILKLDYFILFYFKHFRPNSFQLYLINCMVKTAKKISSQAVWNSRKCIRIRLFPTLSSAFRLPGSHHEQSQEERQVSLDRAILTLLEHAPQPPSPCSQSSTASMKPMGSHLNKLSSLILICSLVFWAAWIWLWVDRGWWRGNVIEQGSLNEKTPHSPLSTAPRNPQTQQGALGQALFWCLLGGWRGTIMSRVQGDVGRFLDTARLSLSEDSQHTHPSSHSWSLQGSTKPKGTHWNQLIPSSFRLSWAGWQESWGIFQ